MRPVPIVLHQQGDDAAPAAGVDAGLRATEVHPSGRIVLVGSGEFASRLLGVPARERA